MCIAPERISRWTEWPANKGLQPPLRFAAEPRRWAQNEMEKK